MRYSVLLRKGWIALLAGSLVITGLILSAGSAAGRPAAEVAGPKLVLAFYYCWYGPDSFTNEPGRQMSDRPATAYISDHADVIDRQIIQAQGAGIDGFIYSWMGHGDVTANNFPKVLSAAAQHNFKLAVYFEVDAAMQRGDISQQLQEVINYSNDPAYLRWNDKPVFFFWRAQAYGGPGAWRALRDRIDPHRALIWSVDTTEVGYLDAFDTVHLFSGGKWNATTDVARVDKQWRDLTDQYNRDHGTQRLWVAGVIPGWDESRVLPRRPNAKVFPRQDGKMYETDWQAALDSHPEWVVIISWNEWFEGTQIEPSARYGNLYLDLTRKWSALFKASQPQPPKEGPKCESMNGHQVCGRFLDYWSQNGGIAQQGYPISEERVQPSLTDQGKSYTVQYFERAIFELHPDNIPPQDVQLTLLGSVRYQCKYPNGAPNQRTSEVNPLYFPDTRHTVGGAFRAYWESHGGLAQQGFPISEEFTEASDMDPGQTYTVQYFQRAVFEYHPGNAPPNDVLLAQLGTYQQQSRLCSTPVSPPAPPPPVVKTPPTATAVPTAGPPGGKTGFQPKNLRFFTSAAQGCNAGAKTSFTVRQTIYAQVAMAEAPAGTTIEVTWSGGANGYNHTDSQITDAPHKPVCVDGFSLEPSRYGIGPGKYQVTLTIDGVKYNTVQITVTN